VTGTNDLYNLGVSDSNAVLPANQDLFTTVIAALPSGTYEKVVSPHGLFAVSAGANVFFLLGQKTSSASDDAMAYDSQLTLVYFPTSYGTVEETALLNSSATPDGSSTSAPDRERAAVIRRPLTSEAVAAERAESIAANQARLARELAEMRARFDALQQELEAAMRAQQAAANEVRGPKPAVTPPKEGQ
jgi:hypothetical protein